MHPATNEHSPLLSSDDELLTEDEETSDEDDFILLVIAFVIVIVYVIENGGFEDTRKKKPSDLPNLQVKKTKKRKRMVRRERQEIYGKLSKLIDVLTERIKNRDKYLPGCSFSQVMQAVECLPGIKVGCNLWKFATRLFKVQEEREMFSAMKKHHPDIILKWLNYKLNLGSSSYML